MIPADKVICDKCGAPLEKEGYICQLGSKSIMTKSGMLMVISNTGCRGKGIIKKDKGEES